jgi:hypothetical protein
VVSDERALATWLAERDDQTLASVFAARGVPPTAAWHDYFDAAAALLEPASVDRALTRLPRAALIAITRADAATHVPAALALLDDGGRALPSIAARVGELAAAHPEAFAPAEDAPPRRTGGEAAAAERAFTTAGSLTDVLLACLHAPLVRTGTGAIAAVDRKRLVEAGAVDSADELEDLVASAAAAQLARATEREWIVTGDGESWLEAPTAQRWTLIVEGFLASLPLGLRTADGRVADPALWPGAHPLDAEWPARAERLVRIARRWGLFAADGSVPAWSSALLAGEPLDASLLAEHLPAEIDQVYLQADLTAIAPGPLAPALDLRLRGIAMRESRAQASTYRFTAESLGAGMTEGETAHSIRTFLGGLSLTGIPQPLDYLVESTAARHGLVRVRQEPRTGRTRVESLDPSLRDAIAVDQALRAIGLVRDGDALSSRVGRDAVYWSLADARYPVVALDASGAPEPLHRRTSRVTGTPSPPPAERYARLLATLRSGHSTDAAAAWLGRELEQAVRAKATIVVVVRLPGGDERTFTLEASGLGGGRLRGRDKGADVERTLPVTSIVSVRVPG